MAISTMVKADSCELFLLVLVLVLNSAGVKFEDEDDCPVTAKRVITVWKGNFI